MLTVLFCLVPSYHFAGHLRLLRVPDLLPSCCCRQARYWFLRSLPLRVVPFLYRAFAVLIRGRAVGLTDAVAFTRCFADGHLQFTTQLRTAGRCSYLLLPCRFRPAVPLFIHMDFTR